jgi:hypothetical protein
LIRTFLDSGVLIAAVSGRGGITLSAINLLKDPEREFVSSVFIRLEILPKAIHFGQAAEVEFYRRFFSQVVAWAEPIDRLVHLAEQEAAHSGLSALDGLHVAAALMLDADELVTTEGPRKPIHRVTQPRIVGI